MRAWSRVLFSSDLIVGIGMKFGASKGLSAGWGRALGTFVQERREVTDGSIALARSGI
jgi:hypothetical protein